MERDARTRFSFDRLDESHAHIATRYWALTSGHCDYLGEWHTHPERHPEPSGVDRSEWRKIYEYALKPLLFWIEGAEGRWLGIGQGRHLYALRPTDQRLVL